jgi:hypothetical protein
VTDLWKHERLLATWPAGIPWGEKGPASRVGGTLLLTDQRLIFELLEIHGDPVIVQITDAVVSLTSHYVALADIAAIFAIGKYPRIQVDLRNGQRRSHFVIANRLNPIWSKKSLSVRNDAAERINKAAEQARRLSDDHFEYTRWS